MCAITELSEARKSRQRVALTGKAEESVPAVGCATYMPEVYKISMVRMWDWEPTDEHSNVRV